MKRNAIIAAALSLAVGISVQAQDTVKVPVKKDTAVKKDSAAGNITMDDSLMIEWFRPMGTTCSSVDVNAAKAVTIKSDLYKPDAGFISPDSAKVIALCAVPGQVGSGEMNVTDGRTQYEISIIPNEKKTTTKVIVDAKTGAVMSSKQFGGLRGLAGWVRESAEHKMNKGKADTTAKKPPPDSTAKKPPR